MIKFESGSHWYTRDGEPQHDADLRVARKDFLYPSPTSIDKATFPNEFLSNWKVEQVALAAAKNFRQPHESEEDYVNRIYQLSLDKPRTAADFGTILHAAIEDYPKYPEDPMIHPWLDRFGEWYEANVLETISQEAVFVDHDLGVAGRGDRVCIGKGRFEGKKLVLDYKSQNVKVDKKGRKIPSYYDSWTRQLAFYSVCEAKKAGTFPEGIPTPISLVFDSNAAETPFEKVWSAEETRDAYLDFCAGAWLFFSKRAYWPAANGKWSLNPSIPMPLC